MIRIKTGLFLYQQTAKLLAISPKNFRNISHLPKFYFKRNNVKHNKLALMCLYSSKSNKEDVILNTKSTNKEIIQDVIEQNRLRATQKFRATEQALREKKEFIINDIKQTKSKMKERMGEVIVRENIYTIPNLLCIGRIVASPYLGYLIVEQNYHMAFALLVVAGITDLVTYST